MEGKPGGAPVIAQERLLSARILIVDDQQPNVRLLEKILTDAGYTNVHSSTDGREAVRLYLETEPDLLLLDLRMPDIDGFRVMEALSLGHAQAYLPILVLTADPEQDTKLRALARGAKDFVAKPFDPVEVLTRIRNILEVRLLYNDVRDQNRVLEFKVRERTKDLRDTQLEVIYRLARVAEYRDNDTGRHILRMARYCAALAEAAGLDEGTCERLYNASPMHDIGKIGIPDSVLLKPGKLTATEWEIMRAHTTLGAELLSGSPSELVQMGERIALTHHERWDGSGYPSHLKGEDIPLEGRICALCDVFDALTSERPYKRKWTVEEALEEITRGEGKHFDPRLAGLFRDVLPQIREAALLA